MTYMFRKNTYTKSCTIYKHLLMHNWFPIILFWGVECYDFKIWHLKCWRYLCHSDAKIFILKCMVIFGYHKMNSAISNAFNWICCLFIHNSRLTRNSIHHFLLKWQYTIYCLSQGHITYRDCCMTKSNSVHNIFVEITVYYILLVTRTYRWYPVKRALSAMLTHGR